MLPTRTSWQQEIKTVNMMHLSSLPVTTVTTVTVRECHPGIANEIPATFINRRIVESIDSKCRNVARFRVMVSVRV